MCDIALVGVEGEPARLRAVLESAGAGLDTDVRPAPELLQTFSGSDAVVCVTLNGCSCALLQGLGRADRPKAEAHVAGPGYSFRRALAAATLRFGEVRLVIHKTGAARAQRDELPRRRTTLSAFLRFGLQPDDGLVSIVA